MALRISVVVVSQERPEALMRCLDGVAQLDHPDFELVVVACKAGQNAVAARADAAAIKLIAFDEANISAARNAGINAAAGDAIAFIDDDAVPEPLWLAKLTAPLGQGFAASGGFVLGRNGISLQWGARHFDQTGATRDLPLSIDGTPDPAPGHAIKTEGTNMAVRRDVLVELGGFDPNFRFYMDETDLNWRLFRAGRQTAIVPDAVVHHGFAASSRRHQDRTPRDLSQIGASHMVFLRKHCPEGQWRAALKAFRQSQRLRLLRLMQSGPLGADDVLHLMRGLRRGIKDGRSRDLAAHAVPGDPEQPFLPFPARPGAPRLVLGGRIWQAGSLRKQAANRAAEGAVVSLFLFSPTTLFHRVRFTANGVWEQRGGLYGRSVRDMPLFAAWRFRRRVAAEARRVAQFRGNPFTNGGKSRL